MPLRRNFDRQRRHASEGDARILAALEPRWTRRVELERRRCLVVEGRRLYVEDGVDRIGGSGGRVNAESGVAPFASRSVAVAAAAITVADDSAVDARGRTGVDDDRGGSAIGRSHRSVDRGAAIDGGSAVEWRRSGIAQRVRVVRRRRAPVGEIILRMSARCSEDDRHCACCEQRRTLRKNSTSPHLSPFTLEKYAID